MSADSQLSRRERQIMDVLHAKGQATAAEVLQALPEAPGYSAVRALLRILEQKSHVRHRQDGKRYVYFARTSRQSARRSALKRVVATFFQGSAAQAVAALLETTDTELSDEEAARLQELIQAARREGR